MAKQTTAPKPKKSPAGLFERFQGEDSGAKHREWLLEKRTNSKANSFKEGKLTHYAGETVAEYTDSDFPPDEDEAPETP